MNEVFKRIIISVFVLLVIMLGMITVSELNLYNKIENQILQDNKARLVNAISLVDMRIEEMEQGMTRIIFDDDTNYISKIQGSLDTSDYYRIRAFSTELSNYNIVDDFVYEYYVYFKDSGILTAPYTTSVRPKLYFDENMKYMNMSYSAWIDKIGQVYHDFTYWGELLDENSIGSKDVITCLKSFPLGSVKQSKGVLIMNIKKDTIADYILNKPVKEGAWFFIADHDNNVVLSNGIKDQITKVIDISCDENKNSTIKIDGIDTHVLSANSNRQSWTYYVGIPSDEIENAMSNTKVVLIITLGLLFLVALVGGVYVSYFNSRPIIDFIDRLGMKTHNEQDAMPQDLISIEKTVDSIIENNNQLKEELSLQTPMLRAILIERLINGRLKTEKEIEEAIAYIDKSIDIESENIVSIMHIDRSEDDTRMSKNMIIALNEIKSIMGASVIVQNIDINNVVIIIFTQKMEDYRKAINKKFESIRWNLALKYNIIATFYLGKAFKGLVNLYSSFEEANLLMQINDSMVKNILWYDDISTESDYFYYPFELENKLIYLAKSGHYEEIEKINEEIRIKNTVGVTLTKNARGLLKHLMKGTLLRTINDIGLNKDECLPVDKYFKEYDKTFNIRNEISKINAIYKVVCQVVNDHKKSHNTELTSNILRYIDDNFTVPDLVLDNIATNFNLSKKYISTFFTEQVGMSFSKYLEKKRMDYAVLLLEKGNTSISDICQMAGYLNKNTFYKAFKRIYGTSPTNYLK